MLRVQLHFRATSAELLVLGCLHFAATAKCFIGELLPSPAEHRTFDSLCVRPSTRVLVSENMVEAQAGIPNRDPMQEWSSPLNLFFFNQAFPAVRFAAKQTLTEKELREMTNLVCSVLAGTCTVLYARKTAAFKHCFGFGRTHGDFSCRLTSL